MGKEKLFKGGEFLITDALPEEVFTPEDFSKDQNLVAQSAEEFGTKELLAKKQELQEDESSTSEGAAPESRRTRIPRSGHARGLRGLGTRQGQFHAHRGKALLRSLGLHGRLRGADRHREPSDRPLRLA